MEEKIEEMRLQKFLASSGIASRRKCEELINDGKIKVNGNIAILGTKVNPKKDIVEYNGKQIKLEKEEYTYLIFQQEQLFLLLLQYLKQILY